jgi:hypothetical protein
VLAACGGGGGGDAPSAEAGRPTAPPATLGVETCLLNGTPVPCDSIGTGPSSAQVTRVCSVNGVEVPCESIGTGAPGSSSTRVCSVNGTEVPCDSIGAGAASAPPTRLCTLGGAQVPCESIEGPSLTPFCATNGALAPCPPFVAKLPAAGYTAPATLVPDLSKSLAGTDADRDGVRDDIAAVLAHGYSQEPEILSAMMRLARLYQSWTLAPQVDRLRARARLLDEVWLAQCVRRASEVRRVLCVQNGRTVACPNAGTDGAADTPAGVESQVSRLSHAEAKNLAAEVRWRTFNTPERAAVLAGVKRAAGSFALPTLDWSCN